METADQHYAQSVANAMVEVPMDTDNATSTPQEQPSLQVSNQQPSIMLSEEESRREVMEQLMQYKREMMNNKDYVAWNTWTYMQRRKWVAREVENIFKDVISYTKSEHVKLDREKMFSPDLEHHDRGIIDAFEKICDRHQAFACRFKVLFNDILFGDRLTLSVWHQHKHSILLTLKKVLQENEAMGSNDNYVQNVVAANDDNDDVPDAIKNSTNMPKTKADLRDAKMENAQVLSAMKARQEKRQQELDDLFEKLTVES